MQSAKMLGLLALGAMLAVATGACGDDDDDSSGTGGSGTAGSGTAGSGTDVPADCVTLKACCDAITTPSDQKGCLDAYGTGTSTGLGKICKDDLDHRHELKECP